MSYNITYEELRKMDIVKAREIVRSILNSNNWNVSKTASILSCSTKCIRRARDWSLEDESKKPKTSPKKTETSLENLIIIEWKSTWYRYRRLAWFILDKYWIIISEDTVKAILKRNKVEQKKVRTYNSRRRPLYDYEHLAPFTEFQLDTKHILDQNALPKDVYEHILKFNLPIYEWNIIDVITKTRFTAYSHELTSAFWRLFVYMVIFHLRSMNVRNHINIQADNWLEFCHWSKRKEDELNKDLNQFNVSFSSIPAWKHYLQAIVENSHRHDDEQFLSIHPIRCSSDEKFIYKCQCWQDTWNTWRKSYWIWMEARTPKEKLNSYKTLISSDIFKFPVVLLENLIQLNPEGGTYVPTNYQKKWA